MGYPGFVQTCTDRNLLHAGWTHFFFYYIANPPGRPRRKKVCVSVCVQTQKPDCSVLAAHAQRQQIQSLGMCICLRYIAWGCVCATNTMLGVVYLQQTQSNWGCAFAAGTKLGAVYLQQAQSLELCMCNKSNFMFRRHTAQ